MDTLKTDDGVVVAELKEQVKRLETRIVASENHGKRSSTRDASGFVESDESIYRDHDDETELPQYVNYLPQIRKCNFMEFKNRFCEEDARYAVDVLVAGDSFQQEYLEEKQLREKLFDRRTANPKAARRSMQARAKETEKNNDTAGKDRTDPPWIRRIRIQAPVLIKLLAKVRGEVWNTTLQTYDRPFCTLVHFHPQVKQALAELEDKWITQDQEQQSHSSISYKTPPAHKDEEDMLDDSKATLEILRAYVEFMDTDIIPEAHRYDNLKYPIEDKIRFSDLCNLFKPGDYLYRPLEGEQTGNGVDYRTGERIWRVFCVNDAVSNFNYGALDHVKYSSSESREYNDCCFVVQAYYVDFTGDEFCVVPNIFRIPPYEGLMPIKNLPFYPLPIENVLESPMRNSMDTGDLVLQYMESKHAFYNDWSVIHTPTGNFIQDTNGVVLKHPEHINSEVMVDFQEAFNACPAWRPARTVLKAESFTSRVITDQFAILWWSGNNRIVGKETGEIGPERSSVHNTMRNKFVLEDPFLVAVAQNSQRSQPTTKEFIRWEEKCVMFCRVYAYIFQERKFAQLDVARLTPSTRNYDALDALKIPRITKSLIQGSVRGHFLQKEYGGEIGNEGLSLDMIQGKGTGLFILLHGVPGVGKTATAEAVAQANGKPLFKITCGDIGLKPNQVETSLRAIFRLASLWDCILLMDEVDTFFSQRSKADSSITKNALVSVFLRVLDYYTGILFLTTNRSGALDEAFKSRIHYKIYYPPLSKGQTLDIWELNIQRLRQISEPSKDKWPLEIHDIEILRFAEEQFDNSAEKKVGQWNGRQIRNAFQVARSLAYYDAVNDVDRNTPAGRDEPARAAVLDTTYFKIMHEITESFDKYMSEVFNGQNDGDLALEMEHRADHFRLRSTRGGREDYDRYQGYNGVASSFNVGVRQEISDQRRNISQREDRLYISGQGGGASQRYLPNSFALTSISGYDETGLDSRNSGLESSRIAPHVERAAEDIIGLSPHEKDHSLEQSSHSGRRTSLRGGSPDGGSFRRNSRPYSFSREGRHQSDFEADQGYRMERNDYGKRERP